MSLSRGNYLVEEIGRNKDPYLSMEFLEVHNETEKNAVLEPLRCFIPVVARPKTIIISLSLKLISFIFCEIFSFFCCILVH